MASSGDERAKGFISDFMRPWDHAHLIGLKNNAYLQSHWVYPVIEKTTNDNVMNTVEEVMSLQGQGNFKWEVTAVVV